MTYDNFDDWDVTTNELDQSTLKNGIGDTIASKNNHTIQNEHGTYHLQDGPLDQTKITSEDYSTIGYIKEDALGQTSVYDETYGKLGDIDEHGNIDRIASYPDPLSIADQARFQSLKLSEE
ncbi:hypothetical protein J416_13174 [Gracilibacillus halophilus YIM-C55.5]|uniref:Uncharacterized protein n=1 Tax=Gracilibacillus halophilus YIM-C55.5 TaxID=1308866 RepID=N4WNC6_9BACI|nr:hypothetical protein [Gracilibacillus halophilus]ENH95990.1 hypothetical protein J416_13174 [Gracilibacillus halophilus YIM-C55.5]